MPRKATNGLSFCYTSLLAFYLECKRQPYPTHYPYPFVIGNGNLVRISKININLIQPSTLYQKPPTNTYIQISLADSYIRTSTQNLQPQPPPQLLLLPLRTNPISLTSSPSSALNMGKLGLPPLALNSGFPLGLPLVLYSAPPSASVTLPPVLPVDSPHSNNSRILFFDPPNKILFLL